MTVAPAGSLLGRLWHLDVTRDGRVYTIDNVEGMCRSVLNPFCRTNPLEARDYEEALMFLCGETWVMAEKWMPGRGAALGPFVYQRLQFALFDYAEKTWGGRRVSIVRDDNGEPAGEVVTAQPGHKRVVSRQALERAMQDAGFDGDDWDIDPGDPRQEQALERLTARHEAVVDGPETRADALEEALLGDRSGRRRPDHERRREIESLIDFVDWDAVPTRTRRVATRLLPMMYAGYKNREIAGYFGRSDDWVTERIRELRVAAVRHSTIDLRTVLAEHVRPSLRNEMLEKIDEIMEAA